MCCGMNKKKGIKPSALSAIRKKEGRTSKFSATKKSYQNGKKS